MYQSNLSMAYIESGILWRDGHGVKQSARGGYSVKLPHRMTTVSLGKSIKAAQKCALH